MKSRWGSQGSVTASTTLQLGPGPLPTHLRHCPHGLWDRTCHSGAAPLFVLDTCLRVGAARHKRSECQDPHATDLPDPISHTGTVCMPSEVPAPLHTTPARREQAQGWHTPSSRLRHRGGLSKAIPAHPCWPRHTHHSVLPRWVGVWQRRVQRRGLLSLGTHCLQASGISLSTGLGWVTLPRRARLPAAWADRVS